MKKPTRRIHPTLLMFFGFILVLAVADLLTPVKNFSELENRYLKQPPTFSLASLLDGSYTQNVENYVNDQFVGRDSWISVKSKAETALLKVENNGIVYGKDGRLFEKYTSYDQEQLSKNLAFLEEFAAGQSNVTFSVVPAGYMLTPEDLPAGLQLVDQGAVLPQIQAAVPSAHWIDTLDLLSQSGDQDLYYRTDHHWRVKGAYLFYEAFCQNRGLEPAAADELPLREVEGFYGTYFSKCKKTGIQPDTLSFYDIPVASVTVDGVEKENWYDEAALSSRDKYGALLYGNGGLTILRNGDGERKLLLIKDSYSNALAPIFLQNYDQVYIVDLRSFPQGMQQLCAEQDFTDILILYSFSNICSDTNFYRLKY